MKKLNYIFIMLNYFCFSQSDVPLTLRTQFNGPYGYTIIGNTNNLLDNWQFPNPPCQMLTLSSSTLNLLPNQNVIAAYLYWHGIGDGMVDQTLVLNGLSYTQTQPIVCYPEANPFYSYYSIFKDITNQVSVTGNGIYTISDFDLNLILPPYCTSGTYNSGWTIIIVYNQIGIPNNQLNIYDGLNIVNNQFNSGTTAISINNLNVIDNANAKMTYVSYNGSPNLFANESITFNGNVLSNVLNPSNNPFNGTNSFTGSTTNWNQDIDTFDISPYINIGDTQANITLNSTFIRTIQTLVTSIRSELPDATAQINQITGQEICNNRNLRINYTVANTNSNAILQTVPVSFYANGVLLQTISTPSAIAIGGNLVLQTTVVIPAGISSPFDLKIIVDNNASNASTIAESNENNNSGLQIISLLNDSIIPTFNLANNFCQNASVPVLSTISNNAILGTWSPNVINNQASGVYVFTPNAGQCAIGFTLSTTISPLVTPTFNLANNFCQNATVPTLPNISNNSITGIWSPNSINNQVIGTYVFTPNAGQCATGFTLNTIISPLVTPIFNLANTFCSGATVPNLPTTSSNAITGTWSPSVISNQNNGSYVFTPNVNQCATGFTLNTIISPFVTPIFNLANTFCTGATVPNLPTTSSNAITGTWSPSVISNQNSGSYVFTPTANCATGFTLNTTISPLVTPTFNLANTFCTGAIVPVLPTISGNSIAGTWTPSVISNQNNGSYVFTPTANCATGFTLNTIISPLVTPTFNLVNTFCTNATVPSLPTTSGNSIAGTWTPSVISNQNNGSYVFTPNTGQCATGFTLNTTIQSQTPSQEKIEICFDENGLAIASEILDSKLSTNDYDFVWIKDNQQLNQTTAQIAVISIGNYILLANPKISGCQKIINFIVNAIQPIKANISISEDFALESFIKIETFGGNGEYLYSFDNLSFQKENIYFVKEGGDILIKIKDSSNCYEISKTITIWKYPAFFTPNGDGVNDTWSINTTKNIKVVIFDRFGKLIKQLKTGDNWDGNINSQLLLANDYWFVIYYDENKTFRGHFSLLR